MGRGFGTVVFREHCTYEQCEISAAATGLFAPEMSASAIPVLVLTALQSLVDGCSRSVDTSWGCERGDPPVDSQSISDSLLRLLLALSSAIPNIGNP